MSVIDGTAATLAELFRAGSHGTGAGAVVRDGPMALAVASHLTADELARLRAASRPTSTPWGIRWAHWSPS